METMRPTVALVGAGAVGRSLGMALSAAGMRVSSVVSALASEAGRLAVVVGAEHSDTALDGIPHDVDAVFLCVPDDAIRPVARDLARLDRPWKGVFVAHTSGSHTAASLDPLAHRGARVASFHPLQSFPRTGEPKAFKDSYVGIEGEADALEIAERIAVELGARAVRIPASMKTRYHLAASIASNYLTTLLTIVDELFATQGRTDIPDAKIFLPLVRETLDNIEAVGPLDALTGPVVRGDVGTITLHLESLRAERAHLLPVYSALAMETVRAAVRGRHLAPERAEQLLSLIEESIEPE